MTTLKIGRITLGVALGLAVLVLGGNTISDYFAPADGAYYVGVASRLGSYCLTRGMCNSVDSTGKATLSGSPLGGDSPCARTTGFKVLSAIVNAKSGYAYVLLKCDDKKSFLFQYASIGKHKGGVGEWLQCVDRSCKSDSARLPPGL